MNDETKAALCLAGWAICKAVALGCAIYVILLLAGIYRG